MSTRGVYHWSAAMSLCAARMLEARALSALSAAQDRKPKVENPDPCFFFPRLALVSTPLCARCALVSRAR